MVLVLFTVLAVGRPVRTEASQSNGNSYNIQEFQRLVLIKTKTHTHEKPPSCHTEVSYENFVCVVV